MCCTSRRTLYLNAQIDAGAQAVMIFDTWGGVLAPEHYREFSLRYMQRIVAGLPREREGRRVPVILFTKGRRRVAERDGANRLRCARRRLDDRSRRCTSRSGRPRRAAGQSRPELSVRLAGDESAKRSRECSRATVTAHGHVFNLGHGIHPSDPARARGRDDRCGARAESAYHT